MNTTIDLKSRLLRWFADPIHTLFTVFFLIGIILSSMFVSNFITRRIYGIRDGVGVITEIRQNALIVTNRRQQDMQIVIIPETTIHFPDKNIQQFAKGQTVLISGVDRGGVAIEAKYIRVISAPQL